MGKKESYLEKKLKKSKVILRKKLKNHRALLKKVLIHSAYIKVRKSSLNAPTTHRSSQQRKRTNIEKSVAPNRPKLIVASHSQTTPAMRGLKNKGSTVLVLFGS